MSNIKSLTEQFNNLGDRSVSLYNSLITAKKNILFQEELEPSEMEYDGMLEIDLVDKERGEPFGAYVYKVDLDKGIFVEAVNSDFKGWVNFTDISDMNFRLSLLEKMDSELATPQCYEVNGVTYLLARETKPFDLIGDDLDNQVLYELQNMNLEMKNGGSYGESFYSSSLEPFTKATLKRCLEVKEFLRSLK